MGFTFPDVYKSYLRIMNGTTKYSYKVSQDVVLTEDRIQQIGILQQKAAKPKATYTIPIPVIYAPSGVKSTRFAQGLKSNQMNWIREKFLISCLFALESF